MSDFERDESRIYPGDVVRHNADGRHGRVVTTNDGVLNVEPEHATSQEQWLVGQVTPVAEGDYDAEALDARIDPDMLDGSGILKGDPPPAASLGAGRQYATNTEVIAHPEPVMVASGVHQSLSDQAAEAGMPDAFDNPKADLSKARQAAMAEGLMLSEVDPAFAQEYVDQVAKARERAEGPQEPAGDSEAGASRRGKAKAKDADKPPAS